MKRNVNRQDAKNAKRGTGEKNLGDLGALGGSTSSIVPGDLTVDAQKEDLIGRIESRLKQAVQSKELFVVRWKIT